MSKKTIVTFFELNEEEKRELARKYATKTEEDVQAEVEASAEAQANAEVPADAETEAPALADAETQANAEAPAETEMQTHAEAPTETQANAPAPAETETQSEANVQENAEAATTQRTLCFSVIESDPNISLKKYLVEQIKLGGSVAKKAAGYLAEFDLSENLHDILKSFENGFANVFEVEAEFQKDFEADRREKQAKIAGLIEFAESRGFRILSGMITEYELNGIPCIAEAQQIYYDELYFKAQQIMEKKFVVFELPLDPNISIKKYLMGQIMLGGSVAKNAAGYLAEFDLSENLHDILKSFENGFANVFEVETAFNKAFDLAERHDKQKISEVIKIAEEYGFMS